jgi:hypothetical protein
MNSEDYNELIRWLQMRSESIKFGEIVIKITLHDGVRYIERSISEKTKIGKTLTANGPFIGEQR